MPDVRTIRLVKVAEDVWVDPTEVTALVEEYFEGSHSWLTRIHVRHVASPLLVRARADEVMLALTGDLR